MLRPRPTHAVALKSRDGDGLLDAAERYAAFGDRIAAADAAAQAALMFRSKGLRGASAHRDHTRTGTWPPRPAPTLPRYARTTPGCPSPVGNARSSPSPQRDCRTAKSPTDWKMSVRTVEGHLFRASQQAGVNSRTELIQLVD